MQEMQETWLTDTLCSFGEKVRVELGPQIIKLECSESNLSDRVTAPHYHIGGRDAHGRVIMPSKLPSGTRIDTRLGVVETGEPMFCVDWKAKHVPRVWKIYQQRDAKFIQIGQDINREAALALGRTVAEEMKNALH